MAEWTVLNMGLIAAAGTLIGFMAGMFGVGGGVLLVPVLHIALGIPIPLAVGSVTCFILGPATTAVLTRRPDTGLLQLPLILLGGLFCGVITGSEVLVRVRQAGQVTLLGRVIPVPELVVLGSYAVVMAIIAGLAIRDAMLQRPASRRAPFSRMLLSPVAEIRAISPSRHSIPLLAWTGVAVGFLSGFLGISGGLLLIPVFTSLMGLRLRESVTVSIVIVWLVSLGSTVTHAAHGNIDLRIVMLLLVGGTVGARFGADVGMHISSRRLKVGFAGMVVLSLLLVLGRLIQLWYRTDPNVT
ncbi:MAG: sulfite exporter TauE/SafE family protein [Planctomycetaceae bacterium]|nr:sulfite exporter TauE/SafE family protein [Planctomycetaceae bacterium]